MSNTNTIQPRLQYNYAQILLPLCMCVACFTCTYEIDQEDHIAIPYTTNDYMDKFYNFYGDKMWYWDEGFTRLWEECPSHNV